MLLAIEGPDSENDLQAHQFLALQGFQISRKLHLSKFQANLFSAKNTKVPKPKGKPIGYVIQNFRGKPKPYYKKD